MIQLSLVYLGRDAYHIFLVHSAGLQVRWLAYRFSFVLSFFRENNMKDLCIFALKCR
jgi:hypothetical protein